MRKEHVGFMNTWVTKPRFGKRCTHCKKWHFRKAMRQVFSKVHTDVHCDGTWYTIRDEIDWYCLDCAPSDMHAMDLVEVKYQSPSPSNYPGL